MAHESAVAMLEREASRFANMGQVDACLNLHVVRDRLVALIDAAEALNAQIGFSIDDPRCRLRDRLTAALALCAEVSA